MSWHSDDEPGFRENPVIGSVSFGGTRTFQLRHKVQKDLHPEHRTHAREPAGNSQGHSAQLGPPIPKTAREVRERLNLTFRLVRLAGS